MITHTALVVRPGRLIQWVWLAMFATALAWLPHPECIARPGASGPMDALNSPPMPADLPSETSLQLVGARVAINGQIADVWALSATVDASWLTQSIEARWRGAPGATVHTSRSEGWQVVSRLMVHVVETVQIRQRGQGSYGYLTRWRPTGQTDRSGSRSAAWLPKSIELGSQVTSHEREARVTTIIGTSTHDPKALADELTAFAQSQGFKPVSVERPREPDSTAQLGSAEAIRADRSFVSPAVLRFAGRAREMVVTIERNERTSIVVAHLTEVLK